MGGRMANRKLSQNAYFIPGFTNIGVINARCGKKNSIYLVDSGPDEHSARSAVKELENIFPEGFEIRAVINTHGHSDHVGGNRWIQDNFGSEVWITKKETAISLNGFSNVNYIWGASAIPELKLWYSLRETFSAERIIAAEDTIELEDSSTVSFIDMNGHSAEQVGVLHSGTDGKKVLFTGDSYLGLDELYKSKISFQEAPLAALDRMKRLLEIQADFFIQSHGIIPATSDEVFETIGGNIRALEKVAAYILYILNKKSLTTEAVVSKIIGKFKIYVKAVNFALIYSTVKSLLSELYERKIISAKMKDGFFCWTKI